MECSKIKMTLIALAISNVIGQSANAADINVGSSCSLVDAIVSAETDIATGGCDAGNGSDVITLPANSTHDLTQAFDNNGDLTTGTPEIQSVITINGFASTITRNTDSPDFRIFRVVDTGDLTIQNVTISSGRIPIYPPSGIPKYHEYLGGCLLVERESKVILNDVTVSNCNSYKGGAIALSGNSELTLQDSTISSNFGRFSGGISAESSNVVISESTISNNYSYYSSAGISLSESTLSVTDSRLDRNYAKRGNGGAISSGNSNVHISGGGLRGNSAGYNGGAISSSGGSLTITNSNLFRNATISYNPGSGGALSLNGGVTIIANTTMEENRASYYFRTLYGSGEQGGAIRAGSEDLTIINSTLVDNKAPYGEGHAIFSAGGLLKLKNTIISGDQSTNLCVTGEDDSDVDAGLDSIIQDGSCGGFARAVDPMLAPRRINGGNTVTHALLPGSPAIDIGDAEVCNSAPINGRDQRRFKHVGRCDAGAFEYGAVGLNELNGSFVPPLFLLLED